MAGLGRPSHPVERTGIARGQKIAQEADGLLIVLDASRPDGEEDRKLIRKYRGKKTLDRPEQERSPQEARGPEGPGPGRDKPCRRGFGPEGQEYRPASVPDQAPISRPGPDKEEEIILHAWQKDRFEAILEALRRAEELLRRRGIPRRSVPRRSGRPSGLVGELTGEVRVEEVLDDIFGRFCVGK